MFTGIISGVGRIVDEQPLGSAPGHGKRLVIDTPPGYLDDVQAGDSIAINGACMTVTSFDAAARHFCIDISAESLDKTAGLGDAARHDGAVNLEKALRANDRLDGHLVSGHVDGVGRVIHFAAVGESWTLRIDVPPTLAKFLAYKGSITVNGVSLTVNRVVDRVVDDIAGCEISINLIPHTIENTALGHLTVGAAVNLEVDLIARYVERMQSVAPAVRPV